MSTRRGTKTSFKSISNHTYTSISSNEETRKSTACRYHPKSILELYCSFCEKPVCKKCKLTTHARHVVDVKGNDALKTAAKLRRRNLVRLLDVKQKKIVPLIKTTVIQIMEGKGRLEQQVETAIEKYKIYVNKHRDKMAVSEDEWIYDVMNRASKFHQTMEEKVEFLKKRLMDVTSTLTMLNDELRDSSDAELLLMFGELRSDLESLHAPKWPHEEVAVSLQIQTVPEFGAIFMPTEDGNIDKNCQLDFNQVIVEPTVYSRVLDTQMPIPKRVLRDENAKISVSCATEMYVSFGEYIVVFPLDNRRYEKVATNVRFTRIMTVRQNIIDISCDTNSSDLYFAVQNAIKKVTRFASKVIKSFSLVHAPSAICVSSPADKRTAIFVGFHDAGKIVKYTPKGHAIMELMHPDPRMIYRPRHLTVNYIGDIFFSDDISNVTVLDTNGIWKGTIGRDAKGPPVCRLLKPTGIACTSQRHVFVIDANAVTNVHIFSEDGTFLQTVVFKNLQDAYVLCVDKTDDMWIAFKDGRLRIYRPSYIRTDIK